MAGMRIATVVAGIISLPAAAQTVRVVPLVTNDIAYNPLNGMIYASIPQSAGAPLANSIAVIDPVTGTVGPSVFIGYDPWHITISDSGQYVYVSFGAPGFGGRLVARIDTTTHTVGPVFDVDVLVGCTVVVQDIQAVPGNENAVAISRFRDHPCLHHGGVAVYENGVLLPNSLQPATHYYDLTRSRSPDALWGYHKEPGFELHRLAVTPDGISIDQTYLGLINAYGTEIEGGDGAVYSTTGRKIDAATGALLGTFPFPSGSGTIEPDSANHRLWMWDTKPRVYDDETLDEIASFTVALPGFRRELIRWGADGLAMRTNEAIVLVNTPLVHQFPCYPNCDYSSTPPILNVADFTCFLQRFAAGHAFANCDQSTTDPGLNVADFTCFLQSFAAGCP